MIYTQELHNDTDMTLNVWENSMKILIEKNPISKNEFFRLSGYGNKNRFFEYLNEWEENNWIEIKQVGREKQVSLASPNKKVDSFIKNFGKRLDNYEKLLNKHLSALKKNKPIISPKQPMKKVPIKVPVLELDKKHQVYRDLGKREDSHAMTWKTRAKPTMHFETILNLLNKLYQESSVLTFGTPICDDATLMKEYQTKSQRLLQHTIIEIENMFRGETDFVFVITRIRMVLYGLVYKATVEAEIKKSELASSVP